MYPCHTQYATRRLPKGIPMSTHTTLSSVIRRLHDIEQLYGDIAVINPDRDSLDVEVLDGSSEEGEFQVRFY